MFDSSRTYPLSGGNIWLVSLVSLVGLVGLVTLVSLVSQSGYHA